jgi:hypothetical protein
LVVPFLFPSAAIRCMLQLVRRAYYSYLALRCHDETLNPVSDFLMLEYFTNPPDKALAVGGTESNEQDAAMRSWSKSSEV